MSRTKVTLVDLDGNYVPAGGGGGGGVVTQGTTPWLVGGQGTAGSAATGVVTVQGIAAMTKLLVTPDSVALPANQSVNNAQINGVTPLMGNGVSGTGAQRVTIASDSSGIFQPVPGTSGGLLVSSNLIPNNNTAIVIKASAGQLYGIRCYVNSSVIAYIKVYNATSATAGSGTPVDRHMIPAPAAGGGGGLIWADAQGVAFSTGITIVVVTDFADNGTTAPAANSYIVNCYYK